MIGVCPNNSGKFDDIAAPLGGGASIGGVSDSICFWESAALTCAGVAMRDLVSACTVTRNSSNGTGDTQTTLLLDPGAKEEAEADAGVTLAYMRTVGEATQVVATGTWDGDTLDDAVQLAASRCRCQAGRVVELCGVVRVVMSDSEVWAGGGGWRLWRGFGERTVSSHSRGTAL